MHPILITVLVLLGLWLLIAAVTWTMVLIVRFRTWLLIHKMRKLDHLCDSLLNSLGSTPEKRQALAKHLQVQDLSLKDDQTKG